MKRFCSFLLALIFTLSITVAVSAANEKITISKTEASKGDTVEIDFSIENNPGIAAMTISITYDSNVLEYINFKKGFLSDYDNVVAHPKNNLIRFVNLERTDVTQNGTFLTLIFKVADDAQYGSYKIDIDYSDGDFCNYNAESISPEIISGGVDLSVPKTECEHTEFTEWNITSQAECEKYGLRERSCKECGFKQVENISALGHSYENKWTVDKEALGTELGHMSRHCTRCDEVTDIKYFSQKQSQENNFGNNQGTAVEPNDFTGEPSDDTQSTSSDSSDIQTVPSNTENNTDISAKHIAIIIAVCIILIAAGILLFIYFKKHKTD